jgi:hypothetical protein
MKNVAIMRQLGTNIRVFRLCHAYLILSVRNDTDLLRRLAIITRSFAGKVNASSQTAFQNLLMNNDDCFCPYIGNKTRA